MSFIFFRMLYSSKKGVFGNAGYSQCHEYLFRVHSLYSCLLLWAPVNRTSLSASCLIRPPVVDFRKTCFSTRILSNYWQILSIWMLSFTNSSRLSTWVVLSLMILCSSLFLGPYTIPLLKRTWLERHTGSNRNDTIHRNVHPGFMFPLIT